MALAVWQSTITNESGDIQASAQIEVRNEATGALAAIYADRDGNTPLDNPFNADENGFARFYAAGGAYKITASLGAFSQTYRHQSIGLLAEQDVATDDRFYYRQTAAEVAAGVTPKDYSIPSHEAIGVVHAARYGVVGDFTTDDTDAMEDAISVCLQLEESEIPQNGTVTLSNAVRGPALFIPGGWRVKITDGLTCPLAIVSDGFAKIECADTTTTFFTGSGRYYFYAEGIICVGGATHFDLSNANLNAGRWEFNRCEFFLSNDYAVRATTTSDAWPVVSTILRFNECKWRGCRKELETECDHTWINGGWHQPQADWVDEDSCMIKNTGLLHMNDVELVGLAEGSTKPDRIRWIDNHGAVAAKKCRFPAEAAGFPVIYHFAKPVEFNAYSGNYVQHGIVFDDCELAVGPDAASDSALVNCRGEIPMRLSVTNCSGLFAGKAIILVEAASDGGIDDLDTYLADLESEFGASLKHQLFYNYHANIFQRSVNERLWPEELDLYTYTDRPLTPRICKIINTGNQTITQSTTTVLTFASAEYDPYDLMDLGAVDGIRAPEYAKFAKITAWVEVSSHAANNNIYTLRLYNGSTEILDARVNYLHEITGTVRIQAVAEVAVTYNDLINARVQIGTVGDQTCSRAMLTAEFF